MSRALKLVGGLAAIAMIAAVGFKLGYAGWTEIGSNHHQLRGAGLVLVAYALQP